MMNLYSVGVPVKDQDKAIEFYTKKLGFKVVQDEQMKDMPQRWIELEIPGTKIKLTPLTPEGQEDRIGTYTGICFSTDNIEKTVEELKGKGVKFSQEITKEDWGKMALFHDQDDNVFCLAGM